MVGEAPNKVRLWFVVGIEFFPLDVEVFFPVGVVEREESALKVLSCVNVKESSTSPECDVFVQVEEARHHHKDKEVPLSDLGEHTDERPVYQAHRGAAAESCVCLVIDDGCVFVAVCDGFPELLRGEDDARVGECWVAIIGELLREDALPTAFTAVNAEHHIPIFFNSLCRCVECCFKEAINIKILICNLHFFFSLSFSSWKASHSAAVIFVL